MRTEYIWEIKVKNTPTLKRKCNHCNSNRFYCSNKFRMNAQKRNIDVWLIYRCVECDSTYNLTILSRTKPELIKKDLFSKFSENDEKLSWEYAFSSEIGREIKVRTTYFDKKYGDFDLVSEQSQKVEAGKDQYIFVYRTYQPITIKGKV